jgi:hypothetical protein
VTDQVRSALGVAGLRHMVIDREPVMHDGAVVVGEHADTDEGLDPSSGMHYQQGEQPGREGVNPVFGVLTRVPV